MHSGKTPIAKQVLVSSGLFGIIIGNNKNNILNYFLESYLNTGTLDDYLIIL